MDEHEGVTLTPASNPRISRKRLLVAAAGATGMAAAGVAGVAIAGPRGSVARADATADNTCGDTPQQIFTAALIAEDLATTFYYNGLVGPVIQDPNLAGKHGTATRPSHNKQKSNPGNVDYLRAALSEEIAHANLMRALIGGSSASGDPVRTFYFPDDSFDTLDAFTGLLNALENAFIGAYLAATKELAAMAADTKSGVATYRDASNTAYSSTTLEYFAEVAASIMGIEAEHRVLGRVISNSNPANNLCYEQTDDITCVYNGSTSAVAALTPFLGAGRDKRGYALAPALAAADELGLPCTGGIPKA